MSTPKLFKEKDPELVKWGTAKTMVALAARYPAPEYAFLPQVRNATGAGHSRTADALAIGLWPSRGLILHGFEVKVSRGDWLSELRNPAKADRIASFCDRWWIVTGAADIVQDGELPATWGLLIPKGGRLVVKVEAPEIDCQPIDRKFLAAILRKAQEVVIPRDQIDEEIRKARDDSYKRGLESGQFEAEAARRDLGRLRDTIRSFETASGLRLESYRHQAGDIGAAVRFVLDGGIKRSESRLRELRVQAASILGEVDRQLAAPKAAEAPAEAEASVEERTA
jgi:hypothetical protein